MARYNCRTLDGSVKRYRNKIDSYSDALDVANELGLSMSETGWLYTAGWFPKSHPDLNSGDGLIYVVAKDRKERQTLYDPKSERCMTYVIDVNSVIVE